MLTYIKKETEERKVQRPVGREESERERGTQGRKKEREGRKKVNQKCYVKNLDKLDFHSQLCGEIRISKHMPC